MLAAGPLGLRAAVAALLQQVQPGRAGGGSVHAAAGWQLAAALRGASVALDAAVTDRGSGSGGFAPQPPPAAAAGLYRVVRYHNQGNTCFLAVTAQMLSLYRPLLAALIGAAGLTPLNHALARVLSAVAAARVDGPTHVAIWAVGEELAATARLSYLRGARGLFAGEHDAEETAVALLAAPEATSAGEAETIPIPRSILPRALLHAGEQLAAQLGGLTHIDIKCECADAPWTVTQNWPNVLRVPVLPRAAGRGLRLREACEGEETENAVCPHCGQTSA